MSALQWDHGEEVLGRLGGQAGGACWLPWLHLCIHLHPGEEIKVTWPPIYKIKDISKVKICECFWTERILTEVYCSLTEPYSFLLSCFLLSLDGSMYLYMYVIQPFKAKCFILTKNYSLFMVDLRSNKQSWQVGTYTDHVQYKVKNLIRRIRDFEIMQIYLNSMCI